MQGHIHAKINEKCLVLQAYIRVPKIWNYCTWVDMSKSLAPFYIVSYYTKRVKTSWAYSRLREIRSDYPSALCRAPMRKISLYTLFCNLEYSFVS